MFSNLLSKIAVMDMPTIGVSGLQQRQNVSGWDRVFAKDYY
jgi:hypothetical protein